MSTACEGMSVHRHHRHLSLDCLRPLFVFRFAGYIGKGYDEVIVEGDVDKQQFVAYYVKDNRVRRVSLSLLFLFASLFVFLSREKFP